MDLINDRKLVQHEIYDEMKKSYIDYSMSVIVARALPDVEVVNINLTGYRKVFKLINNNIDKRKCYLSQYSYDKLHDVFAGHLALEGINYRLSSTPCDEVDTATTALKNIVWHDTTDVYVDHIGRSFIIQSDTCRARYYRALGK